MNLINETLRVFHHYYRGEMKKSNISGPSMEELTPGIDNMGSMLYLLQAMEFFSNFSSDLTIKYWGDEPGDKFCMEIQPAFLENKTDIAVSYYYIVISRLAYSVPLHPLFHERFWCFYLQPNFSTLQNIYIEPFSQELCIVILLFSILFMTSICLCLKVLNVHNFRESFLEALWFIIAFVSLKSYHLRFKQQTLQIILLFCAMFFSLLFAVYSASLTSVLTKSPTVINSVTDLIQYGFTFFALPQIYSTVLKPKNNMPSLFKGSTETIASELESFKLVMKGDHVHVGGLDGYVKNAERLKVLPEKMCETVAQLPFSETSTQMVSGFFVPKNSIFRDKLNIGILRIRSSGVLQRYNIIYDKNSHFRCPKITGGKYQKDLGISQVLFTFIILWCSVPLSISILFAELYF